MSECAFNDGRDGCPEREDAGVAQGKAWLLTHWRRMSGKERVEGGGGNDW